MTPEKHITRRIAIYAPGRRGLLPSGLDGYVCRVVLQILRISLSDRPDCGCDELRIEQRPKRVHFSRPTLCSVEPLPLLLTAIILLARSTLFLSAKMTILHKRQRPCRLVKDSALNNNRFIRHDVPAMPRKSEGDPRELGESGGPYQGVLMAV